MTRDDLRQFDGRHGRPAYVAVSGTVYDVSTSPRWQEGLHDGGHQAGAELTEELKSAPHVRAVIERFPAVGHLDDESLGEKQSSRGRWLLAAAFVVAVVVVVVALLR